MSELVDHEPAALMKEDPETFVLRGRPRPVVRFRRGVIIGFSGALVVSLAAISWIALAPASAPRAAPTNGAEEPRSFASPEALAGAPRSYSDVPRLGPPLPGDLGRPILEHRRSLGADPGAVSFSRSEVQDRSVDSDRLQRFEAKAAAASSPVLVQLGSRDAASASAMPASSPAIVPSSSDATTATASGQLQKVEFARAAPGNVNPGSLHPPPSAYVLTAGTIIPASLITGLNSDLPGLVIAQVTQDVRDSATGAVTLIPQGARLLGKYNSVVAFGQRRALVVWNRIIFPDAASVDLDNMPAADVSGYSGLSDGVDAHTWQLLKGIGLSTLLGVGTELSFGSNKSDLVRAIRESAQQSGANVGAQITGHELDVQPTITVRPGWPVRAILNKDIALQPWRA